MCSLLQNYLLFRPTKFIEFYKNCLFCQSTKVYWVLQKLSIFCQSTKALLIFMIVHVEIFLSDSNYKINILWLISSFHLSTTTTPEMKMSCNSVHHLDLINEMKRDLPLCFQSTDMFRWVVLWPSRSQRPPRWTPRRNGCLYSCRSTRCTRHWWRFQEASWAVLGKHILKWN